MLPPLRAAALAEFINILIFPAVDFIKFEAALLWAHAPDNK